MIEPLTISLRTLTPLWTGGADGSSNYLHETGIIGSMRWWYEAMVRGLGGYACDPASEKEDARCLFDVKAFQRALNQTGDREVAVNAGLKDHVCPACYVFGCTGWRRLFRLEVNALSSVALHLRTTSRRNASWFDLVFGGKDPESTVNDHKVLYSEKELPTMQISLRGHDTDYTCSQLALTLHFIETYAGIGARLQHGFGQVAFRLPPELTKTSILDGLCELQKALKARPFRDSGPAVKQPNLQKFFFLDYELSESVLSPFVRASNVCGEDKVGDSAPAYVPVAFDLRAKGEGIGRIVGLRRWLEWDATAGRPRWPHDLVCQVMGASKKGGGDLSDEERQSSRVFVSMPYRDGQIYRLRWFGFVPPGQFLPDGRALTTDVLTNEIRAYMGQLFNESGPCSVVAGHELLQEVSREP